MISQAPSNPLRARLLTVDDICHSNVREGEKRDLFMWALRMDIRESCPLAAAVRQAICECSNLPNNKAVAITTFNDHNSLDTCCRVFNRALFLVGFRANNPENLPLPKLT